MAETSVIGNTTVIRGNVRGEGDIEVLGRIEGELHVTGNVTLGEDAQVKGGVSGAMVSIHGFVTGDITGTVAVVLGETAHVEGDLITPRVGIAEGARLRGRIDTAGAGARAESRVAESRREAPRRVAAPKAPPPRPEPVREAPKASREAPKALQAAPEKRKLPPPPVVPALRKGARARKKFRR